MSQRVAAIIQARMGSSRLPGKMLLELAGKKVIQHVHDRAICIEGVTDVIVATTISRKDDPLAAYCHEQGIRVFRGSESDVLGRYCAAAAEIDAPVVMRITGDCPLLDPRESGKVLALFRRTEGCDYASNVEPPHLPDGLDTEAMTAALLRRLDQTVKDPAYREHVTLWIRKHREGFKIAALEGGPDLSSIRLTLDESADFLALSKIVEHLRVKGQFGYVSEVMDVLCEHPDILAINRHLERNAAIKHIV